MSSKFKFKLNRSGVKSLLKSDEMQSLLKDKADGIRGRAGEGYDQDIYVGKNRANAMVWADSYKTKKDNLKNNTLLKSVK